MISKAYHSTSKNEAPGQTRKSLECHKNNTDSISLKSCPVLENSKLRNLRKVRPKSSQQVPNVPRLNLKGINAKEPQKHPKKGSLTATPSEGINFKAGKLITKVRGSHVSYDEKQDYLTFGLSQKHQGGQVAKKCKSKFCGKLCDTASSSKNRDKNTTKKSDKPNYSVPPEVATKTVSECGKKSSATFCNSLRGTKSNTSAGELPGNANERTPSLLVLNPELLQASKSVSNTHAINCEAEALIKDNGTSIPSKPPFEQAKTTVEAQGKQTCSKFTQTHKKKRKKKSIRDFRSTDQFSSTQHEKESMRMKSQSSDDKQDFVTEHTTTMTQCNSRSKSEEFVPIGESSSYVEETLSPKHIAKTSSVEHAAVKFGDQTSLAPVLTLPPMTLAQAMTVQIPLTALSHPQSSELSDNGNSSVPVLKQPTNYLSKTVEAIVSLQTSTTQTAPLVPPDIAPLHAPQNAQTAETQTNRQTFRNAETNPYVPEQSTIAAHSNSGDGPSIMNVSPTLQSTVLTPDTHSNALQRTQSGVAATTASEPQWNQHLDPGHRTMTSVPIGTLPPSSKLPGSSLSPVENLASVSLNNSPTQVEAECTREVDEESMLKEAKFKRKHSKRKKSKARRQKDKIVQVVHQQTTNRSIQVSIPDSIQPVPSSSSPQSLPSPTPPPKHSEVLTSRSASARSRRVTYSPSLHSPASTHSPTGRSWRDDSSTESLHEQRLREISTKTVRHNRLFNEKRRSLRNLSPPYSTEASSCQRLADVVDGAAEQQRPPLLDVVIRKASRKRAVSVNAKRKPNKKKGEKNKKRKQLETTKNFATAISRFLHQLGSDQDAIRVINNMAEISARQERRAI